MTNSVRSKHDLSHHAHIYAHKYYAHHQLIHFGNLHSELLTHIHFHHTQATIWIFFLFQLHYPPMHAHIL